MVNPKMKAHNENKCVDSGRSKSNLLLARSKIERNVYFFNGHFLQLKSFSEGFASLGRKMPSNSFNRSKTKAIFKSDSKEIWPLCSKRL